MGTTLPNIFDKYIPILIFFWHQSFTRLSFHFSPLSLQS